MGKKNFDETKKEAKSLIQRILNGVTVNGARWFSIIITLVLLLLFLVTYPGRMIITVLGYVAFILCILYFGYKLYKYTTENAHGVPKPKKVKQPKVKEEEKDVDSDLMYPDGEDPYEYVDDDTGGEEFPEDGEDEASADDEGKEVIPEVDEVTDATESDDKKE